MCCFVLRSESQIQPRSRSSLSNPKEMIHTMHPLRFNVAEHLVSAGRPVTSSGRRSISGTQWSVGVFGESETGGSGCEAPNEFAATVLECLLLGYLGRHGGRSPK